MEIIVQGKAEDFVSPDQVVLDFTFKVVRKTYEDALKDGVENVRKFMDQVLSENGFLMENVKTHSFVVRKEQRYDSKMRRYAFMGYAFEQFAELKFDYDKNKLALIIEEISKRPEAPECHIDFSVKNMDACRKNILGVAFKDAESQATMIAEAAGKHLAQCVKVDFKPITDDYRSGSEFEAVHSMRSALYDEEGSAFLGDEGIAEKIVETFTPEDVRIVETLYCLWVTD